MKKGGEKLMIDWDKYAVFIAYALLNSNKQPLLPYTIPKNQFTLQEVQGKDNVAGILDSNTILLDADDEHNSEILLNIIKDRELNCIVSKREGGRGIHALFLNGNGAIKQNFTNVMLTGGAFADIKVGLRNGYEAIKLNGVEREIIYEKLPIQDIDNCLIPLKGCNIDFKNMDEGDGRNQALFNYILTLQSHDFTNEEIRDIVKVVNKHTLKKPLSEKELEVILRDDAFKKQSFFKGSKFLHDRFAEYLKRDSHIIKLNGQLHIYDNGVYTADYTKIERAMIKEIPFLKKSQRNEVMQYLNIVCEPRLMNKSNLIAFKNGVYNILDDSFVDFSPEIVITNMIPWDYNPAAESELMDSTIDKISCNDFNIRNLLEECIGSCFYRSNTLGGGKAFILTGEGSNGKSTFIHIIQKLLGEENIVALDVNELNTRFKNADIFGKLANIGDDISTEYIPDVGVLKKLITGERVGGIERKGQDPFEFNNYAKFIFSANDIPKMGGAKDSKPLRRRFIIIPFNAIFSSEDADHNNNIKDEIVMQEHIEYAILLGLKGLQRVLKTGNYSKSEKVDEQLEDFEVRNNSVKAFVVECEENEFEGNYSIINEPCSKVYRHYEEFCLRNGLKNAFSRNEFGKQLQRILPITTKPSRLKEEGGKVCKVYIEKVTAS